MKIIILTTDTPHHLFFVKKIASLFNISAIVLEEKILSPDFKTFHNFEKLRDMYESKQLFSSENVKYEDFCSTHKVQTINDNSCFEIVKKNNPEVIISFGTSIIKKKLIDLCPNGFVNLHGGNPEYYRGLDSHLWAIYHKNFDQLTVTLHRVNSKIDDGEIIQQSNIKLKNTSQLFELRLENTKLCINLVASSLYFFKNNKKFISRPQIKKGRYYSFMPSTLKEVCLKNFNNKISSLK